MGAGAIGCWLGGQLQRAGVPVTLVGRSRVIGALRTQGLTLTDLHGRRDTIKAELLDLHETMPTHARPSLVLLCVKRGATAEAAAELATALQGGPTPGPLVVSMQNGIDNVDVARSAAPRLAVLPGMVPFNVAELGPGHYHRGTEGALAAQDHPTLRAWQPRFAAAGLPLQLHADMRPVQWGKLLLNLNNAVNALSGLPLLRQLLDADLRCCTAALIDETLVVLRAAGIAPAQMSPLPPSWVPRVMRLPTPLFRLIAARSLRIDDQARSSMADDLALGRVTEVDAIHGAVERLASQCGLAAPLNQRMAALVRAQPTRAAHWAGAELRRALVSSN